MITSIARTPSAAHRICGPTIARRVVLLDVRPHRGRRVDHQDPHRRQRDDGDEDRPVRLVALAPQDVGAGVRGRAAGHAAGVDGASPAGPRARTRARRPASGPRPRSTSRVPAGSVAAGPSARLGGDEPRDGRLERPAAGGVVHEHVEARRGRRQEHRAHRAGRRRTPPRRRRPARPARSTAAVATASSSVSARSTVREPGGREAGGHRVRRFADQHGRRRRARRRRRPARTGRRPCRGRRR